MRFMETSKRQYITIKLELDSLWDIIFALDDSAIIDNPRLSKRLTEIAIKKEKETRKKVAN